MVFFILHSFRILVVWCVKLRVFRARARVCAREKKQHTIPIVCSLFIVSCLQQRWRIHQIYSSTCIFFLPPSIARMLDSTYSCCFFSLFFCNHYGLYVSGIILFHGCCPFMHCGLSNWVIFCSKSHRPNKTHTYAIQKVVSNSSKKKNTLSKDLFWSMAIWTNWISWIETMQKNC